MIPSLESTAPHTLDLPPGLWPFVYPPQPGVLTSQTFLPPVKLHLSNLSTVVSSLHLLAPEIMNGGPAKASSYLQTWEHQITAEPVTEHTSRDCKHKASTCSTGDSHGTEKKKKMELALKLPQPHTREPESQVKVNFVFSKKQASCRKAVLSLTQW